MGGDLAFFDIIFFALVAGFVMPSSGSFPSL